MAILVLIKYEHLCFHQHHREQTILIGIYDPRGIAIKLKLRHRSFRLTEVNATIMPQGSTRTWLTFIRSWKETYGQQVTPQVT